MKIIVSVFVFVLLFSFSANSAEKLDISGIWGTKYGEMLVIQRDGEVKGTLVKTSNYCPFKNGEEILNATLLEDSLSGKFKMCQADDDCGAPVWAHAVFLVADSGKTLSGSAYSKEAVCPLVGFSKSSNGERGLYFKLLSKKTGKKKTVAKQSDKAKKVENKEGTKNTNDEKVMKTVVEAPILPGPPAEPGTYDPRARLKISKPEENLLMQGKRLLNTGKFEAARKKFQQVLKKDKSNPVALVGVGVTYYGRNEYDKALEYYKKALASDPNYGLAYYNIASIYALLGKNDLAIRYLKISFINGYVPLKQMKEDPDLAKLRKTSEYNELVSGEFL